MISKIVGSIVRRSLTAMVAVALSSAILGTNAQAGSVSGSETFGQQSSEVLALNPGGSNVATATSISNVALVTLAGGTGDFTPPAVSPPGIPVGHDITPAVTVSFASSPPPFSFGDSAFGTFTATSQVATQFVLGTSDVAAITYYGSFDPGTLLPGKTTAPATYTISFTQNGASISESSTLVVGAVPEPSSAILLGLGVSGFLAYRRLRKKPAVIA